MLNFSPVFFLVFFNLQLLRVSDICIIYFVFNYRYQDTVCFFCMQNHLQDM